MQAAAAGQWRRRRQQQQRNAQQRTAQLSSSNSAAAPQLSSTTAQQQLSSRGLRVRVRGGCVGLWGGLGGALELFFYVRSFYLAMLLFCVLPSYMTVSGLR